MNNIMYRLVRELKNELREEIKQEIIEELQKQHTTKKVWMNKKETAAYLGVSVNTFSKYLYKYPDFPVSEIGGAKRYSAKQIDEFIAIIDKIN